MRSATILLAVLAILALTVSANAGAVRWRDGTTGDWHVGTNWYGDNEPGASDDVQLWDESGGYNQLKGTATFSTASGTKTVATLDVGGYDKHHIDLNITGGSLTVTGKVILGNGVGWPDGCHTATIKQTGGTVAFNDLVEIARHAGNWGPGKGQYIISGGSLYMDDLDIFTSASPACTGVGRFVLDCGSSGPSSVVIDDWTMDSSDNEFKVILDSSGNVSTAIVTSGTASFGSGNTLVIDESSVTGGLFVGKTVTLLTAGTLINSMTIDDSARWEYDATAPTGTMRIKCLVPEPATMSLLVLGGLGVLIRRRRA